ncbi:MAG: hypothetical protein LN561_00855, partial [Rickettsia endosymbiont of Labidopullus appendiculatus]|nr:hypothetical protein [Rickettsia endosymbiont of Labidopullus appendiculatus]
IVIEAIKGELTIAQITSKYGVHATQISKWKKQGLELLVQGFKSKAQRSDPNQQELTTIRSQIYFIEQISSFCIIVNYRFIIKPRSAYR